MTKTQRKRIPLYIQILIGMIVGIAIGFIGVYTGNGEILKDWIQPWGQLFIRLLQLIAIPLVFISLVKGVTGLKDISRFSRLGGRTILIYLITTLVAVSLGLSMGLLVKPGNLVDRQQMSHLQEDYQEVVAQRQEQLAETQSKGPLNFLNDFIPNNIISAAGDNSRILQVIFFAIFFGLATLSLPPEKTLIVVQFFDSLNDIILRMVDYIILIAPIGVAALMAGLIADFGGDASIFSALGAYAATVMVALLLLMFLFYPLLIKLFTRIPVRKFIRSMYPVQLFGFTTSSSAATLPINLETTERELGVSPEVSSFVLPIGVTINMDGTSCYQTIAILFIAQVLGVDLSFADLMVIIGMTVVSSIGTPGIPGGSFVILTMVLGAVGIPAEGLALILGIDRPLDMLRTSVNVTGDATVAAMIDQSK